MLLVVPATTVSVVICIVWSRAGQSVTVAGYWVTVTVTVLVERVVEIVYSLPFPEIWPLPFPGGPVGLDSSAVVIASSAGQTVVEMTMAS